MNIEMIEKGLNVGWLWAESVEILGREGAEVILECCN